MRTELLFASHVWVSYTGGGWGGQVDVWGSMCWKREATLPFSGVKEGRSS